VAAIPGSLLRHTIEVRTYLGEGAYGPTYAEARTVRCFVDDRRRLVRSSGGDETVSETTVYCRLDEDIPAESRVTVNGRDTAVISVSRMDGGGLATPDHLELALA
jgi:head-tail adaptor